MYHLKKCQNHFSAMESRNTDIKWNAIRIITTWRSVGATSIIKYYGAITESFAKVYGSERFFQLRGSKLVPHYSANHDISFITYLCHAYSRWAVLFIKTYEHQNKVVRRSVRCWYLMLVTWLKQYGVVPCLRSTTLLVSKRR